MTDAILPASAGVNVSAAFNFLSTTLASFLHFLSGEGGTGAVQREDVRVRSAECYPRSVVDIRAAFLRRIRLPIPSHRRLQNTPLCFGHLASLVFGHGFTWL